MTLAVKLLHESLTVYLGKDEQFRGSDKWGTWYGACTQSLENAEYFWLTMPLPERILFLVFGVFLLVCPGFGFTSIVIEQ